MAPHVKAAIGGGKRPTVDEISSKNIGGTYLLGDVTLKNNEKVVESDIRADETDCMHIENSELEGVLVHCKSVDPEFPDVTIKDSKAKRGSNVHGANMINGSSIEEMGTVDLTTIDNVNIGKFAYVQSDKRLGQDYKHNGKHGILHIVNEVFEFYHEIGDIALVESHINKVKELRDKYLSNVLHKKNDYSNLKIGKHSSVNVHAIVETDTEIGDMVVVTQRAYVGGQSKLGDGVNVQENCIIYNSRLEGNDVTAHGNTILNSIIGKNCAVLFNSYLDNVELENGAVVLPHTIIDLSGKEKVKLEGDKIYFGVIRSQEDVAINSITKEEFKKLKGGKDFYHKLEHRIDHILEGNGAKYYSHNIKGHAQLHKDIRH